MRRLLAIVFLILLAVPAFAVQPDEVLDNPALESRARALSAELRCMVCQNQSIDDSDASLARDLRVLVRERLVAGDSDEQVLDYLVSRYGEFVLLKPRLSIRNLALWATPVALLILAGLAFIAWQRSRPANSKVDVLSKDEEERIAALLDRKD
ncbi:MAG: cytochrome c-type biogenesis protein [Nitratireductor sp.]